MMKLRWKWSWIKLRKDGMFPKDRIKGKDKKRVWIYGSLTTKDYKKVMSTLFRPEDEVYFYNFDYPNSVPFEKLKEIFSEGLPLNMRELEYLITENKRSLIVISGSFYMIGQILNSSNLFQNIAELVNIY